jgi:glyoxylate/hydroxypyruvate reductase A
MTLRIVFCARESTAQVWVEALRTALVRERVDADVWSRDAGHAVADAHAPQADVAVVWRPPAVLFEEQRHLQAVFTLGAGVDALLALPGLPAQLSVFRLEDAGMARTLSEYVLTAVLRVYRRFDRYAASQSQRRWQPEPLPARERYSVGVLGLGVLGATIATTLAGHGFAVRGHARTRKDIAGIDCRCGDAEFASFLDGLDVLVSVLPATPATRGILDHRALVRLARGAHVVNVGRGAVLVEADLLALLDSGHLGGATLDVFSAEPLPADHPFWARRDIVITPHVAAETELVPAIEQVAGKLALWSRGDPVSGAVDRARGY